MQYGLGKMLDDYRLTTAEILYHLPDHPHILQAYVGRSLTYKYRICLRQPDLLGAKP